MNEYSEKGCLLIVRKAFEPMLQETSDLKEIKERIKFFRSEIFEAWCVVAGLDPQRMSRLAITKNHIMYKNKCRVN